MTTILTTRVTQRTRTNWASTQRSKKHPISTLQERNEVRQDYIPEVKLTKKIILSDHRTRNPANSIRNLKSAENNSRFPARICTHEERERERDRMSEEAESSTLGVYMPPAACHCNMQDNENSVFVCLFWGREKEMCPQSAIIAVPCLPWQSSTSVWKAEARREERNKREEKWRRETEREE